MRAASVLLLALLAPAASAGEPVAPVALRWTLKEGDTFYATTRVTQTHTVEVGGKTAETTLTFDLTLRYRVTNVTAKETTVEVTYLAAGIRAAGQPESDGVGEKVRGSAVAIRLDERHALTAVRGHDELLKKFRDAPAAERATAAALFGEGGIREHVGRPFDVLPARAMRVGETVTRDDRGVVGGLATTGKTTTKLERAGDGIAKVAVKSDLTITAAEGPAAPAAKVALKTERAEGGYTFDTRAGRVREFAHETVIGGTITTTAGDTDTVAKITIRQKQTLAVSDKNPVRE